MTLSSCPPPPSSASSLVIDGWILLHRPAGLSPEDFEQALSDLSVLGKLESRIIHNQVYVRWLQ